MLRCLVSIAQPPAPGLFFFSHHRDSSSMSPEPVRAARSLHTLSNVYFVHAVSDRAPGVKACSPELQELPAHFWIQGGVQISLLQVKYSSTLLSCSSESFESLVVWSLLYDHFALVDRSTAFRITLDCTPLYHVSVAIHGGE